MIDIFNLIEQNRAGEHVGLPCFCTANEEVLRTALKFAARTGFPTVLEATCNQVNQFGGYTGMKPVEFVGWVTKMMAEYEVPFDQIILGGDHLGPNPWQDEDAHSAMQKAEELVRDYVKAGFRKIHLDASMACGGEATPSFELVAERAARLCAVAEAEAPNPEKLFYIIGTEVPVPGGETDNMEGISVTSPDRLQETIETHRTAFERKGLSHVWPRIVSVVTQPGVDFSHDAIFPFVPEKAQYLSKSILQYDHFTFEAHSTDYQPTSALSQLVGMHFFFLKVGPELTFRFREAVYAMGEIERHLGCEVPSNIKSVLGDALDENPAHWKKYYRGTDAEIAMLKDFSYSDRVRYYWTVPRVKASLEQLYANLQSATIPDGLVSQYFPASKFGHITSHPEHLVDQLIDNSIGRYFKACGFDAP